MFRAYSEKQWTQWELKFETLIFKFTWERRGNVGQDKANFSGLTSVFAPHLGWSTLLFAIRHPDWWRLEPGTCSYSWPLVREVNLITSASVQKTCDDFYTCGIGHSELRGCVSFQWGCEAFSKEKENLAALIHNFHQGYLKWLLTKGLGNARGSGNSMYQTVTMWMGTRCFGLTGRDSFM